MSNLRVPIAVGCLALLFALCACSRFADPPHVPPPASVKAPPTYPAAQQVVITPTVFFKDIPSENVSFETTDSVAQVLDYYKQILLKEGWTVSDSGDWGMSFNGPSGCPIYLFGIFVTPLGGNRHRFELTPQQLMCLG